MKQMIALWAHPRSRSTALERVFIERGDFHVFHEPFSSCRFAGGEAEYIPFNHLPQGVPSSFREVRDSLLEAATRTSVFHKDMCYHCVEELLLDAEFLACQTNTFIIREPGPTILSHAELFPGMTRDAIGYEALYRVFERVRDLTGNVPIVIHAEDLATRPEAMIKAFCHAVGIAYRPDCLQWKPGMPAQWESWREWHSQAGESTSITRDPARTYTVDFDSHPNLRAYYEHHRPFYELLNQQKLRLPVEAM